MFVIEIAKVKIQINNKYPYLKKLCDDYIIDSSDYDFSISVCDEEIDIEKKQTKDQFSNGYIEGICAYRKICKEILKYNCFLMHACTIKIDDFAYLFLAKSGTGKTTHCKLLKEYLQDKMSYINGDKPIIRIIDGIPYAYGTPWNGKERYGNNAFARIKALIFIERDEYNSIIPLSKDQLLDKVIHQILIPTTPDEVNKTFDLLNITLDKTKQYLLKCNMDISAAICSYNTITK